LNVFPTFDWLCNRHERFRAMAAATLQKRQCDFGGFAPAQSSVEAATASEAASTLTASGGQSSGKIKQKIER